jgi:hypothetical protein
MCKQLAGIPTSRRHDSIKAAAASISCWDFMNQIASTGSLERLPSLIENQQLHPLATATGGLAFDEQEAAVALKMLTEQTKA